MLYEKVFSLLVSIPILVFTSGTLLAVPDYGMDDYLCSCGAYKEQCEPHRNESCDVSNQMFCSDVCETQGGGVLNP